MKTLSRYSFILIAILAVACASEPVPKAVNIHDTLFLPELPGLFRGHQMGDVSSEVKEAEKSNLISFTDSIIQYELFVPLTLDTLEIDLYYAIDVFGLFEIQADIYGNSEGWMKAGMAQIDSGLTANYGASILKGETHTWTTVSPSNNIIEITLGPEIDDRDIQFLSLNLLEPLNNEL